MAATSRLVVVTLLVVVVAAAAAGVAASRSGSGSGSGSGGSEAAPRTASIGPAGAQAVGPALSRAVGRRIVTGMAGTFPSRSLRGRVRRGEVGGVILFGPNVGPGLPRAITALQRAARAGGNAPLLIATDQEGGEVKRLQSLPPLRAPAQMRAAVAGPDGAATGRALLARGINTNLAPVADVNHGSFLGSRSFGNAPGSVASAACAFATGLQSTGVNATLKHFPGLGRTSENTDLHAVRVSAPAGALRADLEPYRRCGGQARLVMVSNATYPALDPDRPAVFSRRIVTDLLRGELRFAGVTVTDTLSAPGITGPTAAVRASRAGIDLLLYVDEGASARGYRSVLRAARARLSRASIVASAARIDALAR
jgi:beta-N-acetylhexosaminidase